MRSFKTSPRLFFYLIYGVSLISLLFYIRFPTEKFKSYWEKKVEYTFSNTKCNIDRIHYAFPLSIVFEKIKITKTEKEQQAVITIDMLKIRPGTRFWQTFMLSGELYAGTVKASLNFDNKDNRYSLTDIMLDNLELSEIMKDQGGIKRKITGRLSGSGNYIWQRGKPGNDPGKINITATSGELELLQPILSLSAIDFTDISFDISIGEQLKIEQGKLKGKDLVANFAGTVDILTSLYDSRLKLSGFIEPRREFLQTHPVEANMVRQYARRYKKNSLPFTAGGNLANPTFRFSR